ncbi:hypothetical protein CIL05_03250 [Virgibacillus profundi]|uniref:Uncharacterized protein n=1 Tax=Virgibacillus profundi TaxID=2024555 RepID=A0A2A2II14_9BACI|nr:hypothetical protein [Virgibacillus profundi]PAV30753.1 hypothetical protein CIL05_03250 [Virgibacillus profundi]PXY54936.1 hypothetical protein CIT14_03325 [Virgibacillus profundi]
MSFLKGLGSVIGEVTGTVIGGTIKATGQITNIEFVEEIGDGVKKASSFAGDKLGEVASGTWDAASGIVTQNEDKLDTGLNDMGKAIGDTAKAAGHTICHVVDNGKDVVEGLKDGDDHQLKNGAKGLIKVGAFGALSLGIIDLVDGADATDHNVASSASTDSVNITSETTLPAAEENVNLVENPNHHHVEPHFRTLADGTTIWVDGDGDTSTDTYEGWTQSNPDYRVKG